MTADESQYLMEFIGRRFDGLQEQIDGLREEVGGLYVLHEQHGDRMQLLAEGQESFRGEVGRRFDEVDRKFAVQDDLMRSVFVDQRKRTEVLEERVRVIEHGRDR